MAKKIGKRLNARGSRSRCPVALDVALEPPALGELPVRLSDIYMQLTQRGRLVDMFVLVVTTNEGLQHYHPLEVY